MRLSIEITPEQHRHLKAVAALQGQTIKDYVLERTLPDMNSGDDEAFKKLETLLTSRVQSAKEGRISNKSVNDIFEEVLQAENHN